MRMFRLIVLIFLGAYFAGGCATAPDEEMVTPENFAKYGKEESVVLEDPVVYQSLFQKVEKAIFVRQGLQSGPSPQSR